MRLGQTTSSRRIRGFWQVSGFRHVPGWCAFVLAAVAFVTPAGSALAADKGLADKGETIVREHCARCHAVGRTGESPNPVSPPFRTLSLQYPVENLAESLAEGIMSGHPDMPVFVFSPHDVDSIIAYLQSIQEPAESGASEDAASEEGAAAAPASPAE